MSEVVLLTMVIIGKLEHILPRLCTVSLCKYKDGANIYSTTTNVSSRTINIPPILF